ncbi:MAG: hypothetical protein ACE5EW_02790 [Thermoplasmata archaeon]
MAWKKIGAALYFAGTIGFVLSIVVIVLAMVIFFLDFQVNAVALLVFYPLVSGVLWGPILWAIGQFLVARSEQEDEGEGLST